MTTPEARVNLMRELIATMSDAEFEAVTGQTRDTPPKIVESIMGAAMVGNAYTPEVTVADGIMTITVRLGFESEGKHYNGRETAKPGHVCYFSTTNLATNSRGWVETGAFEDMSSESRGYVYTLAVNKMTPKKS